MIGSGPLAGLRIIEISAYVAAPLAGLTLAQLGAEVIRVEPVGGQVDRSRAPLSESGVSLYWSGLNKGKRAIEINFRSEEGRRVLADLIVSGGERGGIVITNTDRFPDLSYEALRRIRPDIIHVALRGRQDGTPAVDYTVQARLGLHALTGPLGHQGPVNDVFPFWDITAGLYLSLGLIAAERKRSETGEGQSVTVALEDVALASMSNLGYLTEAQLGHRRSRAGNYVAGMFGRDFTSADGRSVMVVILTTRHWTDLQEMTGTTGVFAALETALGVSFASEHTRYDYRGLIAAVVGEWFEARPMDEVLRALEATSVLHAEYRELVDIVASGELHAHPLFTTIDQPGVERHLAAGSPLVFGGSLVPPMPAPLVGEGTEQVLDQAGVDSDRVRSLSAEGAIGPLAKNFEVATSDGQ